MANPRTLEECEYRTKMAWQLEKYPVEDFTRNPLSSVVAELRFQPVLSIDQTDEKIAEFQDKIRSTFPTYNENNLQEINFSVPNSFSASTKKVFEFGNIANTRHLRLTSGNLALVRDDHVDRAELIEEFQAAVTSLYDVYDSVVVTRFGLLYSNIINKQLVSEELNEPLEWTDLIKEDYFPLPGSNISIETCQFSTQISDNAPTGDGELAARYSLFKQANDNQTENLFRLDIDRSELSPTIDAQNISKIIESYADDIYSLFICIAENKLLDWMRLKEN